MILIPNTPQERRKKKTQQCLKQQQKAQRILLDWSQLPLEPTDLVQKQSSLQAKHFPQCQPLPGVRELLHNLRSTQSTNNPNPVYIALATSSNSKNFALKTDHLRDVFDAFPQRQRVLGDDPRIGKGRGKPLPDIYLLALETINEELREKGVGGGDIRPEECLVFEDAVPGVEAGRRAGMRVVWCPHPGLLEAFRGREEEVLAGLTGVHQESGKTDSEKEAENLQAWRVEGAGKPGELNDGWGELLRSLEDFPYEKYGIVVP